jgi:hypothetical protein
MLLGFYAVWLWAMLPTFRSYMMPLKRIEYCPQPHGVRNEEEKNINTFCFFSFFASLFPTSILYRFSLFCLFCLLLVFLFLSLFHPSSLTMLHLSRISFHISLFLFTFQHHLSRDSVPIIITILISKCVTSDDCLFPFTLM